MTDLRDLVTRSRLPRTVHAGVGESRARERALENRQPVGISRARELTAGFDGSIRPLVVGMQGDIPVNFACEILAWVIVTDQVGAIEIDIWKTDLATYEATPPTVADSITAAATPAVSAAAGASSSTLTGWTTAIAAGDVLRFNVKTTDGTLLRATIALTLKETA